VGENGNGNGRLTGLQRAFVDHWFGKARFNATKAAELAGYQGNYDTLRSVGSENLAKPNIEAEIARRWAAHGMTAEEVIARYSEQARSNIADFLHADSNAIDWDKVRENGHLLKKITHRKGQQSQIEMYDGQHALDMIGKTLGLFVDKQAVDVEITGGVDLAIDANTLTEALAILGSSNSCKGCGE